MAFSKLLKNARKFHNRGLLLIFFQRFRIVVHPELLEDASVALLRYGVVIELLHIDSSSQKRQYLGSLCPFVREGRGKGDISQSKRGLHQLPNHSTYR